MGEGKMSDRQSNPGHGAQLCPVSSSLRANRTVSRPFAWIPILFALFWFAAGATAVGQPAPRTTPPAVPRQDQELPRPELIRADFLDPGLDRRWQLATDPAHPAGPWRLVLVTSGNRSTKGHGGGF